MRDNIWRRRRILYIRNSMEEEEERVESQQSMKTKNAVAPTYQALHKPTVVVTQAWQTGMYIYIYIM